MFKASFWTVRDATGHCNTVYASEWAQICVAKFGEQRKRKLPKSNFISFIFPQERQTYTISQKFCKTLARPSKQLSNLSLTVRAQQKYYIATTGGLSCMRIPVVGLLKWPGTYRDSQTPTHKPFLYHVRQHSKSVPPTFKYHMVWWLLVLVGDFACQERLSWYPFLVSKFE